MSISEFSLHRNIKVFIFDKYNCYFGYFQLDLSVSSQASVITSQINADSKTCLSSCSELVSDCDRYDLLF
jgi:hypothetical protein